MSYVNIIFLSYIQTWPKYTIEPVMYMCVSLSVFMICLLKGW